MASLGAYRLVSKGVARGRWLEGVPEDKNAGLIPPGVFDVWIEATWATDPEASEHKPNGAIADALNYWQLARRLTIPEKSRCQHFIIHAKWDFDLPSYQAQAYFVELKNAP